MAKLLEEIITTVLNLQKQLLEGIDEATATIFAILDRYGETEETIPELDELQSIRERVDSYYTRFYINLRRIYEAQPTASRSNLEILTRSVNEATITLEAIRANIKEIKINWNLT